jgi:hypothetical protein
MSGERRKGPDPAPPEHPLDTATPPDRAATRAGDLGDEFVPADSYVALVSQAIRETRATFRLIAILAAIILLPCAGMALILLAARGLQPPLNAVVPAGVFGWSSLVTTLVAAISRKKSGA